MNAFMIGFLDELEKRGSFKDIVHHPATQAIGYAALAGEGIHLLEGRKGGLGKFYKSKAGRRIRTGTLGVGSAFLAAEAVAALTDLFGKKRKKSRKTTGGVIINVQPPDPKIPKFRYRTSVPKMKASSLRRISRAIGYKP